MNECETDLKTDTENALKKAINKITILEAKNELLEAQIEKMKRCEICNHYRGKSCNYHSNWVKQCKENGMKLFELRG